MTTGFLTMKAAPLHAGHIYLVSQAATQVDTLYVVLSHNDALFEQPVLSLKNRILWLKNSFRDIPHIKIVHVNETGIPTYPNGWEAWANLVKQVVLEKIKKNFERYASMSTRATPKSPFGLKTQEEILYYLQSNG